jgi:hypothetical protein
MDRRNGPVLFLSCAIPQLVTHEQIVHHPVRKTKVVAYRSDSFLEKLVAKHSLDQRRFSYHTRSHKTHFDVLVNIARVFFEDFHKRVVDNLIFGGIEGRVADTTFEGGPETSETNGMATSNDVRPTLGNVVSEEARGTFHAETKL